MIADIKPAFARFTKALKAPRLALDEEINVFLQALIDPTSFVLEDKPALDTRYGPLGVDIPALESILSDIEQAKYTQDDLKAFSNQADALKEDDTRRRQGEFYTPRLYVDLAHKYLEEAFGKDWKEKYIVYDPSCGSFNLTKDYTFTELYLSTLNQSDIDTAKALGYNREASAFQFDFLNDPDEKLPEGLLAALQGERDKEVIILMNPPYGTASNRGTDTTHKAGIAKSVVREQMAAEGRWGMSMRQLFCQFMYRLNKYSIRGVAAFLKPGFLTGSSYQVFRERITNQWGFRRAALFSADEFADVSGDWGISLSLWDLRGDHQGHEYPHVIIKSSLDEGIEYKGSKILYNSNGSRTPNKWAQALETNREPTFRLSSAVKAVTKEGSGRGDSDAIGSMYSVSNSVYHNPTNVALFSWPTQPVGSYDVMEENYFRAISLFTARKTIKGNWINDKDEYLAPNEDHPKYQQFVNDSVIYSLFNNSSEQSSLRQIEYKDKHWDIKNEFFWKDPDLLLELAETYRFDALYQDARYGTQRHVDGLLHNPDTRLLEELSPIARDVLDAATDLLIKDCFEYREIMHLEHPEYHLASWDAGYSQLKRVAQAHLPEKHKAFRDLYREFEAYLRPQVYELGFLLGV